MSLGDTIASLFGKSPIKPIQRHYEIANECAGKLSVFFAAVIDSNWDQAAVIQNEIVELEREADALKTKLRLELPKSLFLPMARQDLLELMSVQDHVANKAKDIAGIMLGRKMVIPAEIADSVTVFLESTLAVSNEVKKAIDELDELIETGFGGREVKAIIKLVEEVDRLEHETDEQQVKIRAILFTLEKDMPPVDVIFLYKVIDWIGDLADTAEKVGGHIQLLISR